MKRNTGKILLLVLAALMIVGTFACQPKEDETLTALVQSLTQERKELEDKLSKAQGDLNETKSELNTAKADAEAVRQELTKLQSAPTPEPTVVTETRTEIKEVVTKIQNEYACGVDCTVNGGAFAKLDGETKVKCVPKDIEGYVFDHWEVDGQEQDSTAKTLELTLSNTAVIRAVFHERHTVTCINCHFQFLNEKNNAQGKEYTEFDFEEDYKNPVTKKNVEGGLISFYIFADIPKKQEVDYWLINGVKYQFPKDIQKFRVVDLDEPTVYEVVFKGQAKSTPQPGRTPTPTTYYNVTCHNCRYKYNGTWYTSGKVPAGTTITISGTTDSTEAYFDGTPSSVFRHFTSPTSGSSGNYVFSYSYVVNSNTDVTFRGVVN